MIQAANLSNSGFQRGILDIFGGCLTCEWQDTMPPAEVFVPALVCCPPQCGCVANGWKQLLIDIFVALLGFPAAELYQVVSVGCARSSRPSLVVWITGATCKWAKICTSSHWLSVLVFVLSLTRLWAFSITGRLRHDWLAHGPREIAGVVPPPCKRMWFNSEIHYDWLWLARKFGWIRTEIGRQTEHTDTHHSNSSLHHGSKDWHLISLRISLAFHFASMSLDLMPGVLRCGEEQLALHMGPFGTSSKSGATWLQWEDSNSNDLNETWLICKGVPIKFIVFNDTMIPKLSGSFF
eukprot:s156_g18.t1